MGAVTAHVALDPLRQPIGEHRQQQRLRNQEQHDAADHGHDAQEESAQHGGVLETIEASSWLQ